MGVKRFVYASSSSVYGIREEPNVTEELELKPLTIYSETKAWSEEVVQAASDDDFTSVIIRPATVCGYSPRMRLDLTVNILTDHAINKGKITVFGGDQKRPNIHIEDMTDLYCYLLELPDSAIAGKVYNAGYENHKVVEIAEIVRKTIGNQVKITTTPSDDHRSYHISSLKIKKELGFTAKHSINEAVKDLMEAYEKGLIPDPFNNISFYNVKLMQNIDLK